jgi:hypothetical protein
MMIGDLVFLIYRQSSSDLVAKESVVTALIGAVHTMGRALALTHVIVWSPEGRAGYARLELLFPRTTATATGFGD